ncbi:heavy-metal-associated domain-containing protein [Glycomyces sp. L485]|uniref:heavy-metal-associated domain-containing protein n=1 Tax=Glycomyces sp. L485 TaxID=2909235 RepID=UPI001F4B0F01|nr:heavy metal-associated domain-containing protein [Glycomyces sp. L485]MCH7229941.1 heavy-metal-associated domain-containing protein [Glycomyces sp. L485]
MIEHRYGVAGMTCGHCASFVTEEIERIEGVTAVNVDLTNDKVIVTSDRELALADVRAAVDEAGYELTGQEH